MHHIRVQEESGFFSYPGGGLGWSTYLPGGGAAALPTGLTLGMQVCLVGGVRGVCEALDVHEARGPRCSRLLRGGGPWGCTGRCDVTLTSLLEPLRPVAPPHTGTREWPGRKISSERQSQGEELMVAERDRLAPSPGSIVQGSMPYLRVLSGQHVVSGFGVWVVKLLRS